MVERRKKEAAKIGQVKLEPPQISRMASKYSYKRVTSVKEMTVIVKI